MKIAAWLFGVIFAALTAFMLLTAGWERPPIDSQQTGYRGTGMVDVINPRMEAELQSAQVVPEPTPLPPAAGPTAGDIYQNVQVLDDLSIARFTRLMQAITEWVSPEQGCAYCHNLNNLAEDSVYTKVVARRMLQMTQNINNEWGDHVQQTGVTCYTCHRGENVPQYGWFNSDPAAKAVGGMAGWRNGQNRASPEVGLTSLPEDPYTSYIDGDEDIRVIGSTALPDGDSRATIQSTEGTYALMIHMSEALGVNCTYCHNSRGFSVWNESTPQRAMSWYGLEMARTLNNDYVSPLSEVLPAHRLGPTGQGLKINCTTCHQGVNKPLNGVSMVDGFPSLGKPSSNETESVAELSEVPVDNSSAAAGAQPVRGQVSSRDSALE